MLVAKGPGGEASLQIEAVGSTVRVSHASLVLQSSEVKLSGGKANTLIAVATAPCSNVNRMGTVAMSTSCVFVYTGCQSVLSLEEGQY